MLQRLGADSMSSDESTDGEDGNKQSRVLVKDWRSMGLIRWLHQLDVDPADVKGQGPKPRFRFYTEKVQRNTKPKKGLPRDAYSATWLELLSEFERMELAVDEKEFKFA